MIFKPRHDGHSNGAEQIAFRGRHCGMDIAYEGIRLTPEEIVTAAQAEACPVIGVSILSESHIPLLQDLMTWLEAKGLASIPVIVGGIIPDDDAARLKSIGLRVSILLKTSSSTLSCSTSWNSLTCKRLPLNNSQKYRSRSRYRQTALIYSGMTKSDRRRFSTECNKCHPARKRDDHIC